MNINETRPLFWHAYNVMHYVTGLRRDPAHVTNVLCIARQRTPRVIMLRFTAGIYRLAYDLVINRLCIIEVLRKV